VLLIVSLQDGVDYNKLIVQFGTERISDELLARLERLSKKPVHPYLKRKLFFSHRYDRLAVACYLVALCSSLTEILDHVEKGQPFYLYTGAIRILPHLALLNWKQVVDHLQTRYILGI
jgi:hypothetical protein